MDTSNNPYAPPTAEVSDLKTLEVSPPLWNPNAAASWSLLFSPVFGAVLHMLNWQAMGQPEKAATSKKWAIGTAVFLLIIPIMIVMLPDSRGADAVSRIVGFGLLIAWYYSIGKSQNATVLARYGSGYERKGWAKPLLLAVAVLIGYMLVAGLVGFLAAMLLGRA
ncbi:hypothetical protein ACFJGW_19230 [Burkholderiaceae bacterium UC74_6]